jgi:hypothetical protein
LRKSDNHHSTSRKKPADLLNITFGSILALAKVPDSPPGTVIPGIHLAGKEDE